MTQLANIKGVGLGLKRELIPQIQSLYQDPSIANIQFVEIAPENWINAGGKAATDLAWFVERYPIVCHGLCLSLGGPDPLNVSFLKQVKTFLATNKIPLYTEHLSYCSDIHNGKPGYLYDLLPIPFTEEAVHYVAQRIRQTQDILEQRIAVENASFYVAAPISEMDEIRFIKAVLEEADCDLHLDINNIYVNSINFGFNASEFLKQIPGDRIVYSHIAGHLQVEPDLLVDTHGENIIDPVWALLEQAYAQFGTFPTLLERDTNIPPLSAILPELNKIKQIQHQSVSQAKVA
ncbi:MAG: HvfB family MNIO-type RiPP peptide maturase [Methylophilus sp.]